MPDYEKIEYPVIEIRIPEKEYNLTEILKKLHIRDEFLEEIKEKIENHHKKDLILTLLEELSRLYNTNFNEYKGSLLFQISRDLRKINSPILPDISGGYYDDYIKHHLHDDVLSLYDIENEYYGIWILREELPPIRPKRKYTKKEVESMLNLLVDCGVIHSYNMNSLYVNSIKGERDSFFRPEKHVEVLRVY